MTKHTNAVLIWHPTSLSNRWFIRICYSHDFHSTCRKISLVISGAQWRLLCTYHKFERTMRGMQGALIVASCFQMLIGFLGLWRNVVRFRTPLSMVPLMTFTGLGLYYLGFQMYLPHYAKAKTKRRVCDRFALLFSVAFAWGYVQILTSSGAYHNASAALKLVVALITLASLLELLGYIFLIHSNGGDLLFKLVKLSQ